MATLWINQLPKLHQLISLVRAQLHDTKVEQ